MEQQTVGKVEQVVRMIIGGLAPFLGIVLLVPGKASLASGAAGIMLVITGLYLFGVGSTGDCPINRRSCWNSCYVGRKRCGAAANRRRSNRGGRAVQQPRLILLWRLLMMEAI
jgi:hypothetical protein